jgi:hypothetical protein
MLARIALTNVVAVLMAGMGVAQWGATQEAELFASDGSIYDSFGISVAISGDTAVVGARRDNLPEGSDAGSAYVFVRQGAIWSEQQKLTAGSPGAMHHFGTSVAIDGDTIAAGAPGDAGPKKGAVYVFVRDGTTWTEQQRLTASDGMANDFLGELVAVEGDTILAGASGDDHTGTDGGSAYVFVRSGTTWTEQAKLIASDTWSEDYFGTAVALSGDTALVGAPGYDHTNNSNDNEGSAYAFVRSGPSWSQQAKLTAGDAGDGDSFGYSAALSGDTAVVGAPSDTLQGIVGAGSAYAFVRSGTTWSEQQKLVASDPGQLNAFGTSAALSGETIVVGAPFGDRDIPNVGSAYLFARSGTTWSEELELSEPLSVDPLSGDSHFGGSVAASGDTLVVGASLGDAGTVDSGAAYAYRITPPPVTYCTAGTSASGCQALLSASGIPSASAASGFSLRAGTVEGAKDGMFFWGKSGKQATPWGNGTSYQCVVPPVTRGGSLPGSGTIGACDGSFVQDLNATWCSACPYPQKNPGAATVVQAQLWYRDPLSTSNQTTSLSDAIELVVAP